MKHSQQPTKFREELTSSLGSTGTIAAKRDVQSNTPVTDPLPPIYVSLRNHRCTSRSGDSLAALLTPNCPTCGPAGPSPGPASPGSLGVAAAVGGSWDHVRT